MRMIAMIGTFPPPMHGVAAVNLAVRVFLNALDGEPRIFDLSGKSLSKAWHVRIVRGARALCAFGKYLVFLISHRRVSVYLSLSAGYGQMYEMLFILAGRLLKARMFLHHHSFLYLNESRTVTRMLIGLSGRSSQHIVLCDVMAKKLTICYPSACKVMVLSNVAWLPLATDTPQVRNTLNTLGFLGNIEREKGIYEFLEVVQKVQEDRHDVRALIAGPFRNKKTERIVREKICKLRNVQYVGAKFGAEKSAFFDSIDALLFPTRNDAEPLTILEAMGRGVPIVAWGRGCIPQIVPGSSGMVIDSGDDYVSNAVNQVRLWLEAPGELSTSSKDVLDRYGAMQREARGSLEMLYSQLVYAQ